MQVLQIRRGDTKQIDVEILDASGDPFPGDELADIFFTVKSSLTDDDDDAVIFKRLGEGIVILEAESGTAVITIDPEDTSSISGTFKGLHWDIQLVTTDEKVYTLTEGVFNIIADVTNRVSAYG